MRTYPTNLTEHQIALLESLLPKLEPHPRRHWNYLIIFNAIFYVLDNGIKWRAMPVNFPPWEPFMDTGELGSKRSFGNA